MNEVSNQPLRRSTIPLDSGSRGGSSTSLVASVPMNAGDPLGAALRRGRCRARCPRSAGAAPGPAAGAAPTIPAADPRSSVVGIIRPSMNRECAAVITSTGNSVARAVLQRDLPRREPQSRTAPRHRPPTSADPPDRSADAPAAAASRSRGTSVIDPVQPTRSASTVAGMSGISASNARTRGSNTVERRRPPASAHTSAARPTPPPCTTVVREIPNRSAIRAFGTPSAASLLISAQSSKVITLQSSSVHFSPPKLFSFRASPTRGRHEWTTSHLCLTDRCTSPASR